MSIISTNYSWKIIFEITLGGHLNLVNPSKIKRVKTGSQSEIREKMKFIKFGRKSLQISYINKNRCRTIRKSQKNRVSFWEGLEIMGVIFRGDSKL